MILLAFEVKFEAGKSHLPDYMGGVLHGYFDTAIGHNAEYLKDVLRPPENNNIFNFRIIPPLYKTREREAVKFGIVLFGNAALAWYSIVKALLIEKEKKVHGRTINIKNVYLIKPDKTTTKVVVNNKFTPDIYTEREATIDAFELDDLINKDHLVASIISLKFSSPLSLASRSAQRKENRKLSPPALESILCSLINRLNVLYPIQADTIGLTDNKALYRKNIFNEYIKELSSFEEINWKYGRNIIHKGLLGELVYQTNGNQQINILLQLGQWLGLGGKSSFGCGSYNFIPIG